MIFVLVTVEMLGIVALYIGDEYYLRPILLEKNKIYSDLNQKYKSLSESTDAQKLLAAKYIYDQKQQNAYVKLTKLWEVLLDVNQRLNEFKWSIKITQYKLNLTSFDIGWVVRLPKVLYMEGGLIDTLRSLSFVKKLDVKNIKRENGGYEFYIKGVLDFNENFNE